MWIPQQAYWRWEVSSEEGYYRAINSVTRNRQRLVMMRQEGYDEASEPPNLIVVQNWFD